MRLGLGLVLMVGCAKSPAALEIDVSPTSTMMRDMVFSRPARGVALGIEVVDDDGTVVGTHVWTDGSVMRYRSDGTATVGLESYPSLQFPARAWLATAPSSRDDWTLQMGPPSYPTAGAATLILFDAEGVWSTTVSRVAIEGSSHPLNETYRAALDMIVAVDGLTAMQKPKAVLSVLQGPGAAPAEPAERTRPADAKPPAASVAVPQPPEGHHPALLDPALATETAPDRFKVRFETTQGSFVVDIHRDWAPIGVDRFYNLVRIGFYDDTSFFRTIEGFVTQWGLSPYPSVNQVWKEARVDDDPVMATNERGTITFAMSGPNSRTTQLFINYTDGNTKLDTMGFAPFGEVVEGMDVVDGIYKTGEGVPRGTGPSQSLIQSRGDAYLSQFPDIDRIIRTTIEE